MTGENPKAPTPTQQRLRGPAEHRYWHYVDVPFAPTEPLCPNAGAKCRDANRGFPPGVRRPDAPAAIKSYDLVWVHAPGGRHSPAPACRVAVQPESPAGDLGGNRVRLCAPPCRLELHYFWDAALGYGTPTEALAFAGQLATPAARRIADTRVQDWVAESGAIARAVVYRPPVGSGPGPFSLTPAYRERARLIARSQVALAGRRLAVLLNKVLGGSESRVAARDATVAH